MLAPHTRASPAAVSCCEAATRSTTDRAERGTLFRCFQRDLDTFVKTQRRLDEVDDLMGYVRLTATGSFLVLPGFTAEQPLGCTLFG